MVKLIHLKEAARMFRRSLKVRRTGFKEYKGDAKQICSQIIEECFDGYYRVSNGHFTCFYARDFGWCVDALLALDKKKQVRATLDYALHRYKEAGRITTSISPDGVAFDFPYEAVDSIPFLIYALAKLDDQWLILKHKKFLQEQIDHYYENVYDENAGLVRVDKIFSSIKDYAMRRSSCYGNSMLYLLASSIPSQLTNPFDAELIGSRVLSTFFNGSYFYEDISKRAVVAADANIFPFWVGLGDEEMFASCLQAMKNAGLDKPFHLKYKTAQHGKMHIADLINSGYEKDAIWMHLAMVYLDVLHDFNYDEFLPVLNDLKKLVEKHKNFLEVFEADGKPFRRMFYVSDESMSWASVLLRWL